MKLKVLSIGRMSAAYLRAGTDDFQKRIRRYLPLEIIELKEEKAGGRNPDIARIRDLEGDRLLAKIPEGATVIVLDERGECFTSEDFAAYLDRHMVHATPEIAFVVGGPYGVSEKLKNRSDLVLSLSGMTLTHQMARLFLLEQIYRAMTILRNEPYHNR